MSKYNLRSMSDEEFERQYAEGLKSGKEFMETAPKAVSARFDETTSRMFFEMDTGVGFSVPVALIQGLQTNDIEALNDFKLLFQGTEIHWDTLDVQFYVGSLLNGRFGTQKWMSSLQQHLSDIGRKGGKAKTLAKRTASIANGKKGGRPKKVVQPDLAAA